MQTHTVTTTTYSFNELSDQAKEKARDWYRECNLDYDWWDCTYEDATNLAYLMGIDIEDISFSGFWSQGDGACFTGKYSNRKGIVKTIKAEAPNDTELHRIAEDLQAAQKANFYQLSASCTHRGHYSHSGCMAVEVERQSDNYQDVAIGTEDALIQALRDFADWIYQQLEKTYDCLNSDEQIDECLTDSATEYEFTEDGGIY